MPSCELGRVYIIRTTLTNPPKAKFAICVCAERGWFVWINSDPREHGHDQLPIEAGCHELVVRDSVIDLSRIVAHPSHEIEDARPFGIISPALRIKVRDFVATGCFVLPKKHALVILDNL